MRHVWVIGIVLGVGVTGGCVAAPPETAPELKQAIVKAPADVAWQRVVTLFANASVPIQTMDKSSGLIVSGPMSLSGTQRKDLLNCSWSGITVNHQATMRFNVLVAALGDSSTIRINTTAIGVSYDINGNPVTQECNSNGTFEQMIISRVQGG
jgi:hypothetical protein